MSQMDVNYLDLVRSILYGQKPTEQSEAPTSQKGKKPKPPGDSQESKVKAKSSSDTQTHSIKDSESHLLPNFTYNEQQLAESQEATTSHKKHKKKKPLVHSQESKVKRKPSGDSETHSSKDSKLNLVPHFSYHKSIHSQEASTSHKRKKTKMSHHSQEFKVKTTPSSESHAHSKDSKSDLAQNSACSAQEATELQELSRSQKPTKLKPSKVKAKSSSNSQHSNEYQIKNQKSDFSALEPQEAGPSGIGVEGLNGLPKKKTKKGKNLLEGPIILNTTDEIVKNAKQLKKKLKILTQTSTQPFVVNGQEDFNSKGAKKKKNKKLKAASEDNKGESITNHLTALEEVDPVKHNNNKLEHSSPKLKQKEKTVSDSAYWRSESLWKEFLAITSNSSQRPDSVEKPPRSHKRKLKVIDLTASDCDEEGKASAMPEETPDDFFDDDSVTVKRLNFNKLCSTFHNDLGLAETPLSIPEHYMINATPSSQSEDETSVEEQSIQQEERSESSDEEAGGETLEDQSAAANSQSENDEILAGETSMQEKEMFPDAATRDTSDREFNEVPINNQHQKPLQLKKLTDGTVVVIIDPNKTVHFNGLSTVEVLHGEIEVLGTSLNKTHGEKRVYSPRGTSLLYLRNPNNSLAKQLLQLRQLLPAELLQEDLSFRDSCAVVWFKGLKEPAMEFVQRHISQKIIPDAGIDFALSGNFNLTKDCEEWKRVLGAVDGVSRVVVCGGKGVGKSTFLRYSINHLLGRFPKVRVVDLDPGQSEFCPPGCLSVTTINEQVFGPNYTHLQTPDWAVLVHINMSYDLRRYFEGVQYLLNQIRYESEMLPTLVNFPGFTQGLGLDISVKTLKLLLPNVVVEIKSSSPQKNYAMELTAANVNGWTTKSLPSGNAQVVYSYFKLDSLAEKSGGWSLEARQAREMCVLSYFGKMMSEGVGLITSSLVAMFNIKVSALRIVNYEGSPIPPLTVNGHLVALCSLELSEAGPFICYGFGFVRGLDVEQDTLVLLTPEPLDRLELVTHLVLSSVTTPPSLLMEAEGLKGPVPYVNVGALVDFGQFTKRPYLPPRK